MKILHRRVLIYRGKETTRREQRTTEKVSVRVYRKQKGRQSMMSTRDDEPF